MDWPGLEPRSIKPWKQRAAMTRIFILLYHLDGVFSLATTLDELIKA
jgi:hypothetical protein